MKIIETKVQKRFADVDMFLHVNNVHQQEYLDLGKSDYYRQVIEFDIFADNAVLVIVSVKTDFLEQIRWQDEPVVRTRVERLGSKSITLHQQIVAGGGGAEVVFTESKTVLVAFDRRAGHTIEIPDKWRERIGEVN